MFSLNVPFSQAITVSFIKATLINLNIFPRHLILWCPCLTLSLIDIARRTCLKNWAEVPSAIWRQGFYNEDHMEFNGGLILDLRSLGLRAHSWRLVMDLGEHMLMRALLQVTNFAHMCRNVGHKRSYGTSLEEDLLG